MTWWCDGFTWVRRVCVYSVRTDWFRFWTDFSFLPGYCTRRRDKCPWSESPGVLIKYLNSQAYCVSTVTEEMEVGDRTFFGTTFSDGFHAFKNCHVDFNCQLFSFLPSIPPSFLPSFGSSFPVLRAELKASCMRVLPTELYPQTFFFYNLKSSWGIYQMWSKG